MTENQMEKIDFVVEPIANEAFELLLSLEKRVPRAWDSMYKRSPVRSLKAAVKHLRKANALLAGIK